MVRKALRDRGLPELPDQAAPAGIKKVTGRRKRGSRISGADLEPKAAEIQETGPKGSDRQTVRRRSRASRGNSETFLTTPAGRGDKISLESARGWWECFPTQIRAPGTRKVGACPTELDPATGTNAGPHRDQGCTSESARRAAVAEKPQNRKTDPREKTPCFPLRRTYSNPVGNCHR